MTEKVERFRLLHGLIKGAVKNMISLVHSRLPGEDLIVDGSNKPRQPELANMCLAFKRAMERHGIDLKPLAVDNPPGTQRMIVEAKEVGLTVLSSDSAYYMMSEYFLREYCHIKFDKAFGAEAVDKAWFEQWNEKCQELLTKKAESVNKNVVN